MLAAGLPLQARLLESVPAGDRLRPAVLTLLRSVPAIAEQAWQDLTDELRTLRDRLSQGPGPGQQLAFAGAQALDLLSILDTSPWPQQVRDALDRQKPAARPRPGPQGDRRARLQSPAAPQPPAPPPAPGAKWLFTC